MTTPETQTPSPTPRDYPDHWEADVLLRDGRTAHLRPILPTDADGLVEFYALVGQQSKYYRFFAPMPTLSDRDVQRFTNVDHRQRVAFVITLAQKILAVGRYDVIDAERAEVAFLVQDQHQGRGIGQLLLEHLAQAGRERGVKRFVAEVLPENRRMIQVFREQGYSVKGGWEEGVMHLEFDIDPTETSIGVIAAREHRSEAASIAAFLNARSVAVIGASRRRDTIGSLLVRNLVLGDYTGRVYVVNPAADSVAGMPSYPTVSDIPGDVDVAIVAVPAEAVQDVVLDCAAKGVHGLVVISSGFAETGEEGRRRQRKLVGLARSYGLRLIGPNCLGVINTASEVSLNASLAPVMPPRGRAGFFCQSGALGTAILEKVRGRGLGLSTFVSAGNRADVSGNDLLQYWEEDDATEVILLYLESIGNPRKFSRIARRVSRVKPIIAVRSGRTTQGVPMGHAVRHIAAPPEAVDAMFKQAGIIQVDTLDEMFDVAQLLAHQPLPSGSRVAIVGNSDALGLLAVDAAVAQGLTVTSATALGSEATAEDFEDALDAAIDDDHVDAVVAVYIPPLDAGGEEVANVLAAVGEQSDKPLVSTFLGREGVPELLRVPDLSGDTAGRGSVPSYPAVEAAVRALARVSEYAAWRTRDDESAAVLEGIELDQATRQVNELLMHHPEGHQLDDEELRALLACYGVDLWERAFVATADEAVAAGERLGWDVVLKATAERLRQRPDQAHVWRNIDDAAEMADAWQSLTQLVSNPADAEFVVQRTAPPGVPIAVNGLEDPLFGPAVSFGIAGALTDLVGDRAFRIPPISPLDAAETVRSVKAAPLLFGFRGSEQVDVEAVEELIRRVAQLKIDLPQVSTLDLVLVHANAEGVSVLHATARVDQVADARSDLFVRRLTAPAADTLPG
ncbi:bifunctional GNAT family N-acetyltransferase/acetate--CoA ligase family protein [Nocardioides aurantiacus]|uniref:Acyl-CoA synthetase (NDP forming) n=1 Tax=Nocardioides aurantiacus TaxID=86796 RepID=A0A3N2CVB6_9ACTN|nr:bifunctional GNAT family N-acetyltransferase/acetate--CoA ligase family protein [Nocardioides aurantiacus]ROR91368.1 acyl-CoA synthetase (NDP forming) [Nocardioides aurantiacus]